MPLNYGLHKVHRIDGAEQNVIPIKPGISMKVVLNKRMQELISSKLESNRIHVDQVFALRNDPIRQAKELQRLLQEVANELPSEIEDENGKKELIEWGPNPRILVHRVLSELVVPVSPEELKKSA